MYRRILAPLDGSEYAECTLQHLRTIAIGCRVPEVILLRVIEPVGQVEVLGDDWRRSTEQQLRADAKEYLAGVADNLQKDGVSAETALLNGRAAEVILDYAKERQVDLIIMSTHGRSGVARWAMGSVADRVVRNAVAPVLIVAPAACRLA